MTQVFKYLDDEIQVQNKILLLDKYSMVAVSYAHLVIVNITLIDKKQRRIVIISILNETKKYTLNFL